MPWRVRACILTALKIHAKKTEHIRSVFYAHMLSGVCAQTYTNNEIISSERDKFYDIYGKIYNQYEQAIDISAM